MKSLKLNIVAPVVAVSLLAAGPGSIFAAPGEIDDVPLFLSSAVQPNIFFLLDDSGSMDWEVLKSNGALVVHGTGSNSGNMDFSPDDTTELRELCVGYNVMAYNPEINYSPWAGVDEDSIQYSDRTLTTALNNPYDNDDTDNLESHFYTLWDDANGDGIYQDGECVDEFDDIDTSDDDTISEAECEAVDGCVSVDDLSSDLQTNYANWYTYYRKREYVAKKALSELIIRSSERMGLGTLHNNNSVGTPIADVDDITLPVSSTAATAKTTLLSRLFNVNSSGGTPLRQRLENVGEYFAGRNVGDTLFGGSDPDDPILGLSEGGSCQQNFTVLLSDGFWNGGAPSVGNADGDNSSDWDGGAYADTVSNTLADVAMKYYETDLDTSLPDEVKIVQGRDNNEAQHMNTYTVAFGINGTLTEDPASEDEAFTWPTPTANNTTTIDDLRHAAYNGRGQFLSAADPQELISSLSEAITDIAAVTGTASSVAFNTTAIRTGSLVFQAQFNTEGWYGDLQAFSLENDPSNPEFRWSAGDRLRARDLTNNPRDIITYNGITGVAFDFPKDYSRASEDELATSQIEDLLAGAPFSASTTEVDEIAKNQAYGEAIISYLRGDFSQEEANGGLFRDRDKRRLGDIINSAPEFVGAPNTAYPDDIEQVPYSEFVKANENRAARVYVGSNGGMVHAFNASGQEEFAYIPGSLYSSASGEGLHSLADPDYTHVYYADGSPKSADVFFNGKWRTVLVGGLRAGGKGVYALDITNPDNLTESNASGVVLWEYTDADLGYTFSDIQIGRMANGRWAAIFGNGYNNEGDGTAKLYIKYLDSADDVEILDTRVGTSNGDCTDLIGSDCNGMSTPALADLDGDGDIDRIYSGDLHGNIWVTDVSSTNSSSWDFAYKNGSSPRAFFTACSGTSCTTANRQPITSKPDIVRHPNRSKITTTPNVLVFFGTGQYLNTTDNVSGAGQTMYGVWDGGWSGSTALTRSNLQGQTITNVVDADADGNVITGRTITQNTVTYETVGSLPQYGWYLDLPDISGTGAAERVVSDSVAIGDILFFSTLIPSSSVCAEGGSGWRMTVDMLTGGLPSFAVVDFNNDGDFENDPILAGQKFSGIQVSPRLIETGQDGELYRFNPDADRVKAKAAYSQNRTSWSHLEY